jgi:electron transfer flavoprotein-quinone oxidoreductase
MDFAMISGAEAAKAIISAKEKGSFSGDNLSSYAAELQKTAIYQDWQTFKDVYPLLENERLFELYPDIAYQTLEALFSPSLKPGTKVFKSVREQIKGKVTMLTVAKDLYQISRGVAL